MQTKPISKPFSQLRDKMSPAARQRAEAKAAELLKSLDESRPS